jgi:integrase
MEKVNFTKSTITAMVAPETGRTYLHDAKEAGLVLMVTAARRKTFQLYKKHKGRPVRVTLGTWPEITVEQARKKARDAKADLDAGINPNDALRQERQEMTFVDLFNQYMERHAKVRKRTWKEDQNQFDRYLGSLANKKLSTITRKDVAALHGKIGKTAPTAANRLLALLSSAFGRAIEFGLWEGNNPCIGIRRFPEQSRDRFLSADELRRFFEALEQEPNDTARDFFSVALLTGARRANVLEMKWADIDLDAATWRIGRTKNGTPQTVALVEPVVELLRERRRQATSVFVFPGKGVTGHLVEPKKGWARICKAAGIEGARIHDLRRTMGSWQAKTGASLPVIGKSLNHKNQSTTAIYARLDLDPVRSAMEKAAAAMLATRDQAPKVIPFKKAGGE